MSESPHSVPSRATLVRHLRTPSDFIRWGATAFEQAGLSFGHGTAHALDDAWYLVLHALSLPPELPERYLAARLLPEERARVAELLLRRLTTRKPAAYLTGEAWFCGLRFTVDERVIVPRSPIAELIAADFSPWLASPPRRILDLCSGSGCIAIACAAQFPEAAVEAAELDTGALAVLEDNVALHGMQGRVLVRHGDLFDAVHGRFDLIVSNPPYVPHDEWAELPAEYHREPKLALVSGDDGMDIVERLLAQAAEHLTEDGTLICEIGASQAEFDARFPDFPAMWPEFEHGGSGVFVVARAELIDWQARRAAA